MSAQRGNKLERMARSERRVQIPGAKQGPASWRNVTPAVLIDTLQKVALAGGALRLGFTRDGGAFAVGVYGDGDPYTVYCGSDQSMDAFLRAIGDGFDVIGNSHSA